MAYEHYKGRSFWLRVRRQEDLILPYDPTSKRAASVLFDHVLSGLADTPPTLRTVPVLAAIWRTDLGRVTPPCPDDPFSEDNPGQGSLRWAWRAAGRPYRPTCGCCGQRWDVELWPQLHATLCVCEMDDVSRKLPRTYRPLAFEAICQRCSFGEMAMDEDRVASWLRQRVFGVDTMIARQVRMSSLFLGSRVPTPTLEELRERSWKHDRVARGVVHNRISSAANGD